MARQIITQLEGLGHHVIVVSTFRSWLRQPSDWPAVQAGAEGELARLEPELAHLAPELWFTYHLYYRAPDLLGPACSRRLGIPYIAAEASHAERRMQGEWAEAGLAALRGIQAANVLLAMTPRDQKGLASCEDVTGHIMPLLPFMTGIDAREPPVRSARLPVNLVCVAMMRHGDKLASYRALADALGLLGDLDWRLTIHGDGEARPQVEAAFASLPPCRVAFAGLNSANAITSALEDADMFVWPGINEAYGMAYLEAQERGLPVVAMDGGGVPSVVRDGVSGILSAEGDISAYAAALRKLILDPCLRNRFGMQARRKILQEHAPENAAQVLKDAIELAFAHHAGGRT